MAIKFLSSLNTNSGTLGKVNFGETKAPEKKQNQAFMSSDSFVSSKKEAETQKALDIACKTIAHLLKEQDIKPGEFELVV